MSDMTTAEALAEARKFGTLINALGKLREVVEVAHVFDGRRGEIEAELAKAKAASDGQIADLDAAIAAKRNELAGLQGSLDSKTGIVALAKEEARQILLDAKASADRIEEEAKARAKAADEAIAAQGKELDKANAEKRRKSAALDAEIAAKVAERDSLNVEVEAIRSKVARVLG